MKRDYLFASEQALRGDLSGWLHDHTEEDEDGCLIWQHGFANHGQTPIVRLPHALPNPKGRKTRMVPVYRVVWEEVNRRSVPGGKVVYRLCQKLGCVNPDCLRVGTPKDVMRVRDRLGLNCHAEKRLVRMAALRRARPGTHLDMEKVREIRAAMHSVPIGQRVDKYHDLAAVYGVTWHSIKKVVNNQVWTESTTASPFRGMFAELGI